MKSSGRLLDASRNCQEASRSFREQPVNSKTCRNSSFVVHRLFTEASGNFPEASGNLPEGFKNLPGICGRNLPASRAVHAPCKDGNVKNRPVPAFGKKNSGLVSSAFFPRAGSSVHSDPGQLPPPPKLTQGNSPVTPPLQNIGTVGLLRARTHHDPTVPDNSGGVVNKLFAPYERGCRICWGQQRCGWCLP